MKKRVLSNKGEMTLMGLALVMIGIVEATDSLTVLGVASVLAMAFMYIELKYTQGE